MHEDVSFESQRGERQPFLTSYSVVLAITKDNVDAPPTLFKTYDTSAAFDTCTLWQVARATAAATTFFKSISVGRDGIEFVDAGFGYNNPCDILIQEAQREFPDRTQMRILSVGTGLGDIVAIKDRRLYIVDALKKMATSSKKVAATLAHRYSESGEYYRFNVDQGLQDITLSDWKQASTISAHTRNYLSEQSMAIEKFVEVFTRDALPIGRSGIQPICSDKIQSYTSGCRETATGDNNNSISRKVSFTDLLPDWKSQAHYVIPSIVNRYFTGRESTLDWLKHKFFTQTPTMALFGLGGVGKTQVALQLAYWAKELLPGYSIYWVPALSEGSFKQAYSEIVRKLAIHKATDDENVLEMVKRHLSSEAAGKWLLIIDNADDLELLFGSPDSLGGLYENLPVSDNGVTLLTTCSREVAVSFAGKDVIELQNMNPEEATAFVEKVIEKDLLCNQAATAQLLEELNWLPLAITQATAYMNRTNISTSRYLDLMHGTENDRISLMSREFRDGTRYPGLQNAVATTWLISFNKIKKSETAAAELLAFMSCIETKAISRSLIPSLDSEEQMEFAIGTLCGYAFITKREDGKIFDMHSLVQLVTRSWVQTEGDMSRVLESSTQHMAIVFPPSDWAHRELWRSYLPHALKILWTNISRDIEERYELCFKVGMCLLEDGRTKDAIRCFEADLNWRESHCDDEHPSRLRTQHELARAYQANGQFKRAMDMLEHVVAVRQKILADEHPSQLNSQHELGRVYQSDGQIKKALGLLEHVVIVLERTVAKEHPDRLSSQHELARAHQLDGQTKKAVKLLEYVKGMRERTLAEDHPDRLLSQQVLATAYHSDGQTRKALELMEHVVTVRQKIHDEEHPSRIASQHQLAGIYQGDGQIKKAIELLEYVVSVRQGTLAERHPARLASEHVLARAYQADGQIKEAMQLLEYVVAIREKSLAEDHPDRLASQQVLATVYLTDGQIKEAVRWLEYVVAVRETTLVEDHPSLLASQHILARACQANGEIKRAVKLLEHVVVLREKTLAEWHPDREASLYVLAGAYEMDCQIVRAGELFQQAMAIRQKRLGREHCSSEALEDARLKAAVENQDRSVNVVFGSSNSGLQIGVNHGIMSGFGK